MLEQRDDVGERLVEGRHVRVRGLLEAAVQAVQQRMRHLVGNDVARQAREHHRARRRRIAFTRFGREVSEQQRLLVRAVIGVAGPQRMRIDAQTLHLDDLVLSGHAARRPQRGPAERLLEMADRRHADGIDHLLVELRIAFGRRPSVLRQQELVVQIDGLVDLVRRRVDVDDLEILADRPGPQRRRLAVVPRHGQRRLVDRLGGEVLRDAGIEGVDAQASRHRLLLHLFPEHRRRGRGRRRRSGGGRPAQRLLQHGAQRPRRVAAVERCFQVFLARGGGDPAVRPVGIGDRLVDLLDLLRHLRQLQHQHRAALGLLALAGRDAHPAAEDHIQPRPRRFRLRQFPQRALRGRPDVERRIRVQDALADLLARLAGVHLRGRFDRGVEQGVAHRFDPHPGLRIVLHGVPMLREPQRRGRRHLRRRRRRAGAIHVHDLAAVDLRPRHVRRIGADRGVHLAVGAVIALHRAGLQPGIGAAVGHHAARRQDPASAARGTRSIWGSAPRRCCCRRR